MIDLGLIRTAAETARPAVEEVDLHDEDGLFGKLPAQRAELLLAFAVGSARHVPGLIAEVERLTPGAYIVGPEHCCEGECDEEEPPDGEWCSHVTQKVATLGDVKRADHLDTLVQSLREAAERAQDGASPDSTGGGRDLAQLILDGARNTYDRIKAWEQSGEEPTWM